MFVKLNISQGKGKPIEITVKGVGMVEPIEASGCRSICTLVDKQDWDAAVRRLDELGVPIRYHKNRPVVNVEEVKKASRKWFLKHEKSKTTT